LIRLLEHFNKGYQAEGDFKKLRDQGKTTSYDERTAGGHIEFSNFEEEINTLLSNLNIVDLENSEMADLKVSDSDMVD